MSRRDLIMGAAWGAGITAVLAVIALALMGSTAGALEPGERRATTAIRAGADDLTAHACNLWGCGDPDIVYLALDSEPWALNLEPPDGIVLAVHGCHLAQSTYDVIQRLDPGAVVGLGSVCDAVIAEASMHPDERQEYLQQPS